MRVKNNKSNIAKTFLNNDFEENQKLLNVILLGVLGFSILVLLYTFIINKDVLSGLLIALICFAVFICILLNTFTKKTSLVGILISILTNDILLPVLFFKTGGIQSGIVISFILGLIFPLLVLESISKYFTFVLNLVVIILTFVLSIIFPEWVVVKENQFEILMSNLISIVIIVTIFCLILRNLNNVYKKQEADVIEAMVKAKKATNAKTAFLSNVTHDIRTPMNAIIGYTEIAKQNVDNYSKLNDCLSKISISSEHLLGLVNDVLEMSRIESGKLMMQYETESIASLVNKLSIIIANEVKEKNLEYNVDVNSIKDDLVICDTLRLKQIFLNLLSNAVKYSKPDGKIYFFINQVSSNRDGFVKYEFHVKDEGCGMSEEFRTRIYEPFERENNSTVTGITGSGLGLAITKNLVEMMGGTISVISEIGVGTEFIVKLEFEIPSLTEIKEEQESEVFDFSGKRILVVEDNDDNREIVCEILETAGFEVDEARNGVFAIDKVQVAAPDYYCAILMDIQMPGKNGYETTKVIRKFDKPGIEKLPIIALSANVYEEDKRKAFDAGMNGYITKPFNINELLKALNYILKSNKD